MGVPRQWTSVSRRRFMRTAAALGAGTLAVAQTNKRPFATRGVVILDSDIETWPWVARARDAELTTIALHLTPAIRQKYVKSDKGRAVIEQIKRAGLHIEYEAHAMKDLLPRELFDKNPEMFRMDESGRRVPDANFCGHSKPALDIIRENAVRDAALCCPTTHRYFYWIDDGMPMCRCPECRGLSDTDQAVRAEHEILAALRTVDPQATLAHLAYANTLKPPDAVKPDPGLFLEFAPIHRRYDIAIDDPASDAHAQPVAALKSNLAVFPTDTAQVLEYWLDVSFFARWKREQLTKIPWNDAVFRRDIAFYAANGIRHVTTFAVWMDRVYVERFGEPPLAEYAQGLLGV